MTSWFRLDQRETFSFNMHKMDDQNVNLDVFLRNGDLAFILLHSVCMSEFHYGMIGRRKFCYCKSIESHQFCSFVVVFLFSLSFHFVQTKKMNISSIFRFVWNYTTLRMLSHQKQICDIILLFIIGSFICLVGFSLDFFHFVNDLFLCFLFCVFHNHVYIHVFINSPFYVFFSLFFLKKVILKNLGFFSKTTILLF